MRIQGQGRFDTITHLEWTHREWTMIKCKQLPRGTKLPFRTVHCVPVRVVCDLPNNSPLKFNIIWMSASSIHLLLHKFVLIRWIWKKIDEIHCLSRIFLCSRIHYHWSSKHQRDVSALIDKTVRPPEWAKERIILLFVTNFPFFLHFWSLQKHFQCISVFRMYGTFVFLFNGDETCFLLLFCFRYRCTFRHSTI